MVECLSKNNLRPIFGHDMAATAIDFCPVPVKHPCRSPYVDASLSLILPSLTFEFLLQLPDLTSMSLEDGWQWGVVVTMVTDDENPLHRRFLHANKIVYRTDDAIQVTPQSTFIPVTPEELLTSEKKFVSFLLSGIA